LQKSNFFVCNILNRNNILKQNKKKKNKKKRKEKFSKKPDVNGGFGGGICGGDGFNGVR
jgi:hypothetical protein